MSDAPEPAPAEPEPLRLPPGIHRHIAEGDYHADPAETPSASSSILRTLLRQSPAHAWEAHPRLNPAWDPRPVSDAQNIGTILHALTLGTEAPFEELDFDDFRTKDAKAARDEATAAGLIPILSHKLAELKETASEIRQRLRAIPLVWDAMQDAIRDGMNEATLIGRPAGVLTRVRYDLLPPPRHRATYDLKFTGLSAEADDFGKKVRNDHLLQAALYPRLVRELRGDEPLFVFVAAEIKPPYGVSLHALDPEARDFANRKADRALDTWKRCLDADAWPSYPALIHYHSVKPWELTAWEERLERDQAAADLTAQLAAKPATARIGVAA